MGKRGPNATALTDAEKELAGIITLPADIGDCPDYLTEDGKECFERLKPLVEKGMCVATDRNAFIAYCAQWATFCRLDRACIDLPFMIEGKNGSRKNPVHDMRNSALQTLTKLENTLGLTPACRARLKVQPTDADKETEKDKRMFGPRE
jgi:P27 family predicted phage terminase small subunit